LPSQMVGRPQRIVNVALHQLAVLAVLLSMTGAYLFGAGVELSQPLFIIEKNTNANVVHYDAAITPDGDLDPREPIIAHWVMAAEDGRREDLTSAERRAKYARPSPSHTFAEAGAVDTILIDVLDNAFKQCCLWSSGFPLRWLSRQPLWGIIPRLRRFRCSPRNI
jgi:hypothetical protein